MSDLDPQYLDGIKALEGFTPKAAWDYKQNSNGYGTKAAFPGEVIDQDTAHQRFLGEMGNASSYVDTHFPGLPEGKRAALSSLTYNAGPGWINSGLGAAVGRGDWEDAASRFAQYNKAGGQFNQGLANRRAKELSWFTGGPGGGDDLGNGPMPGAVRGNKQNDMAAADDNGPPPSLWSQVVAGGPGALFGAPEKDFDWHRAVQSAAGYAMSLDNPKALDLVTQPHDDYQLVQGQDGSMFKLDKRRGTVTPYRDSSKAVVIGQHVDRQGNKINQYGISRGDGSYDQPRINGQPLAAPQDPLYAKGVTEDNFDHGLPADKWLEQYAPDVQSYVKALHEGRQPAAMNPRKGFAEEAAKAALTYGDKIGVPMDAAEVKARSNLAQQLVATADPSKFGGQRIATQTVLEHYKDMLDAIDHIHNSNGLGSDALARLVNRPQESKFNSTARDAALTTLFSKSSAAIGEREKLLKGRSGGSHERAELARKLFDPQKSDQALRAAVRSEYEIVRGRADPLQQTLDKSTLPQAVKDRNVIFGDKEQELIDDLMRRTAPDYTPTTAPRQGLTADTVRKAFGKPTAATLPDDVYAIRVK